MTTSPTSAENGPPSLQQLDDARRRDSEIYGWGRSVSLNQPRNLALWVWLVLVAWGAVLEVRGVMGATAYYAPAMSLAIVTFALYGALLWWFTQRIDRYSSQPGRLRVMAVLWGGCAATWVIAEPFNSALMSLYGKLVSQEFGISWGASLAAPLTEEWGKGLGLLLLVAIAPKVITTAFDGFVLGAFLGLGFQCFENVYYAQNSASAQFGASQIEATSQVLIVRTLSGVGGHIAFSAVFCTGLVLLLGRPGQPRRAGLGAALVALAMFLHFLFDGGAAISRLIAGDSALAGLLTFGSLFGTPLLGILAALLVFRFAVTGERGSVTSLLAPEVARGYVTEDEAVAAAGSAKDRREFRRLHGVRRHRRRAHMLDAVFDLTAELGRTRGETDDRVAYARAEVARLRGTTESRQDERSGV